MSIDQLLFRQVMSRFASGVTVITSACDGEFGGLTVSSFTSLSLNPTLVLFCIADYATSRGLILEAGQFAVNILSEDQENLSRCFASREAERFAPDTYVLSERGLPLLVGSLATLECKIVNTFSGGDHTIIVGEVETAQASSGCPLLYYRSGYHQLERS